MSKAEEFAYSKYPKEKKGVLYDLARNSIIEGYNQAEKDLELTWKDIREIYSILLNVQGETDDEYLLTLSIPDRIENEHREYKETLKRYFEWKALTNK